MIRRAMCPFCHITLTPLGTKLVCLNVERDCDYEQRRYTTAKTSWRKAAEPLAVLPNEVSETIRRHVLIYVREHPWCSVPEIAADLRLEYKPIYDVLAQREEWKIQRTRATPRGPYRYAMGTAHAPPGPEADHKKYALPWRSLKKGPNAGS